MAMWKVVAVNKKSGTTTTVVSDMPNKKSAEAAASKVRKQYKDRPEYSIVIIKQLGVVRHPSGSIWSA